MTVDIMMAALESLSDKHGRKVCEDKGLDKRHQHFQQVYEYRKQHKQRRSTPSQCRAHRSENKDQDDEAENDNMTRNHIRKKTYDQCKGFCENTHDFNGDHDHLDRPRNRWIYDMTPIMLI